MAANFCVTTIRALQIEFDTTKNSTNIRERGLSLERASDFDSAIIQQDVRKPYPEVRYVPVGFLDARLHTAVPCIKTPSAGAGFGFN